MCFLGVACFVSVAPFLFLDLYFCYNLKMFLNLLPQIFEKAEKIILNALIFLLIFVLAYFIAQIARTITRNRVFNYLPQKEVATFSSDLLFYLIMVVGVGIGLTAVGANINAVIAGLGLGGFALGFALRDIIGNFVSGLLIILTKTVKAGDSLKIMNFEGTVRSVNLRHTILSRDSEDGAPESVLVPNNSIFSSVVIVKKKKNSKKAEKKN